MSPTRTPMNGPTLIATEQIHASKYRQRGETFRDAINRIANSLKDNDEHFHEFRAIIGDMRFLPAGRVQTAMGAAKKVTAYNCYVSATLEDSYVHTPEGDLGGNSIMGIAMQAAATMRMGGGIGYDFSTLRPRKALIKGLDSHSSGPVSFMSIFDAVCQCTSSTGHRRGAQMGVLRVDHPDIIEFVTAKHEKGKLEGFNMSIGATDEFMEAVERGSTYKLRFGGQEYGELDARETYEIIMRSTWDYAEPGILFIDTINKKNNLWYCEKIAATNPCGEQPLPPNGACLLGSFNLVKYIRQAGTKYTFDYDQLKADIPHVVRALDNVIDRTNYPLEAQELEAKNKRRMGLGITGLANAGEAMGMEYGTPWFVEFERRVLKLIANEAYRASATIAGEKGSFPLYDTEKYLQGEFVKTLDDDVIHLIRKNGIRNSHLTSIAPTGTISFTADNISSGVEPIYKFKVKRPINMPGDEKMLVDVYDYGFARLGVRGKRAGAGEVSVNDHLNVLLGAQQWVDSAVSKTCNTDGSMPWESFKQLYMRAWHGGAKGLTTFNKDGKRAGLFVDTPEASDLPFPTAEEQMPLPGVSVASFAHPAHVGGPSVHGFADGCTYDPATGRRECA